MFFQELPGFSKFELYPTNSLPRLSHIPVERRNEFLNAEIRVLGEVSVCTNKVRNCAVRQLRNSV